VSTADSIPRPEANADELRPGSQVSYYWETGNGSALSPFRWEVRQGRIVAVERRAGRTFVRISGARGWVPAARIVSAC
jgi:hypothetical protein